MLIAMLSHLISITSLCARNSCPHLNPGSGDLSSFQGVLQVNSGARATGGHGPLLSVSVYLDNHTTAAAVSKRFELLR